MRARIFRFKCLTKEYNDSPNFTKEKEYDYAKYFYSRYNNPLYKLIMKYDVEFLNKGQEYFKTDLYRFKNDVKPLRIDPRYSDFVKRESMTVEFLIKSGKEGKEKEEKVTEFKISDRLYYFMYFRDRLSVYAYEKRIELEDILRKGAIISLELIEKNPDSFEKVIPFVNFLDKNVDYAYYNPIYGWWRYEVRHKHFLTHKQIEALEDYNKLIEEELKKISTQENKTKVR